VTPIPVAFEPIFKGRPWGGRRLESLLGKRLPPDISIGESWDLVSLPSDESRVRSGPLAGVTLRELVRRWGPGLLGSATELEGGFPLLIKFLDATQDLSIQVHPKPVGDAGIDPPGVKHEAWFVVHAEPGARILAGAQDGVTQAEFKRAAGRAEMAELLRSWRVHAGDCFYLPSGTPHALGAGVVVAEVQTPSDVTYRLYDWDRPGLDGRPRELHLADGLGNLRLDILPRDIAQPHEQVDSGQAAVTRLCACERFTIDRVRMPRGLRGSIATWEPLIWIVLRGAGALRSRSSELTFGLGDVLLIPAENEGAEAELTTDVDVLEVRIPQAGNRRGLGVEPSRVVP
jgi:mannose-6-phosphate isomerase